VLLLAAMGIDASTEGAAAAALEDLRRERQERLLEPTRVVEVGTDNARHVVVQLPEPAAAPVRWELELVEESGKVHRAGGVEPHGAGYSLNLQLPARPAPGYHTLRLAIETATRGPLAAEQALIVVPRTSVRAGELLGGRKAWGLVANLYTLRSDRNWGVGDFTDLGQLLEWAAELGAQFVGINPLHALHNGGIDISPYSPVSRLFRNPLYLDVERVPELRDAPEVRAQLTSPDVRGQLEQLRAVGRIDYERAFALKMTLLEPLHRAFVERAGTDRRRAYEQWCAEREPELTDFATYIALSTVSSFELRGSRELFPLEPRTSNLEPQPQT
jgi:hypothetical protein